MLVAMETKSHDSIDSILKQAMNVRGKHKGERKEGGEQPCKMGSRGDCTKRRIRIGSSREREGEGKKEGERLGNAASTRTLKI